MVIIIVFFMILKNKGYKKYSLILILGGALGNLYDRIFGAVPDFIDFHIGDFHWFIFNVADIFISIGVIIMILSEFMVKKHQMKNFKNIIIYIYLYCFLMISCASLKKSLTPQKKSGSEEFLVEKKSPLVMPPNYNKLPQPGCRHDKKKRLI